MVSLCDALSPFFLFSVGEVVLQEEIEISKELFLSTYARYICALKEGKILEDKRVRRIFSSALTSSSDCLYKMAVRENGWLVKVRQPLIQLQCHAFFFSSLDQSFHPMILAKESISWGIQFSYPQIFQDPHTQKMEKVSGFSNTELFRRLIRWLRNETQPALFLWEGKKIASTMRIGKMCRSWVHCHPQLKEKGLCVAR